MHKSFRNLLVVLFTLCGVVALGGTAVSWMGTTYTVPSVGESDWAGPTKVDGLLISMGTNALSKAGGTYTLQADVNFGASYGVFSKYFTDNTGTAATSGFARLSNGSSVEWRNAANSANLPLSVNSSNNLVFNGYTIINSSGVMPAASGGTGIASYTTGDTLYANGSTSLTKLNIGGSSTLYVSTGTAPQWAHVTNAMVDNVAAISRSKLANGSNDHVVINSAAGVMTSEATLAVGRGGTNISSYTTGDLPYASSSSVVSKLGIGSTGQVLKVSAGLPSWGSAAGSLSVAEKTSAYTLTGSDDVIVSQSNGASVTYTLPLASANAGKVFYVVKKDVSGTTNISTLGGDTISNSQTVTLGKPEQFIGLVSNGSSTYHMVTRGSQTAPTMQTFTSGSGTYTTPAGVLYLKVRMVGAGGGGAGGASASVANGFSGTSSTFGTSLLTADNGVLGTINGGAGGNYTINSPAYGTGVSGGSGSSMFIPTAGTEAEAGAPGGNSFFGGGGGGGGQSANGSSGSAGGGGGGSGNAGGADTRGGGGGGAGGFVDAIIPNPSTTYSYTVGAGGAGGVGSFNGGAGGNGYIEVTEYYQ